jgi:hypothetical protein
MLGGVRWVGCAVGLLLLAGCGGRSSGLGGNDDYGTVDPLPSNAGRGGSTMDAALGSPGSAGGSTAGDGIDVGAGISTGGPGIVSPSSATNIRICGNLCVGGGCSDELGGAGLCVASCLSAMIRKNGACEAEARNSIACFAEVLARSAGQCRARFDDADSECESARAEYRNCAFDGGTPPLITHCGSGASSGSGKCVLNATCDGASLDVNCDMQTSTQSQCKCVIGEFDSTITVNEGIDHSCDAALNECVRPTLPK